VELRAKRRDFAEDDVVQEVVAGHDGNRDGAVVRHGTQTVQEPEAVDERHPQVEDDRVGRFAFCLAQSDLGAGRRSNLMPIEAEHSRERRGHGIIVIDDQNPARRRRGRSHGV
jgi:hypothetical protein